MRFPSGVQVYFDAQRDIRKRTFDLYVYAGDRMNNMVITPHIVEMKTIPRNEFERVEAAPLIEVSYEDVNGLIDALWGVGARPSSSQNFGNDERNAMAATINVLREEVAFLRNVINHQLGRIA